MPQYLSTTQPETLLRLRRLDGYRASNRNSHDPQQHQHPTGSVESDQRRVSLKHRPPKPNTSHQSLRFAEAQRSVKRVEDFKQAQFAFGRVIPIRCWSGRLPISSFYRDEYMTQPTTSKRPVSPLSMDGGTTDNDDDDVDDVCSNCIASILHFHEEDPRPASSTNGYSRSTLPHQHTPRNLYARQPSDADRRQPLASAVGVDAGETGDDAIMVGWRARSKTIIRSSLLPQDHNNANTVHTSLQQRETDGRTDGWMNAGRK